jgi:hypothetical protein
MWNDDKRIITSQLSPNEQLLWFGRPRQGFFFRSSDLMMIPFSLMWGGFAIFWETGVWASNAPIFFRLWGVPFVLIGLYMIFGRFFVDVWQRKKTFYGVTNERVIIISGLFNQSVKSLNLQTLTDITLEEKTNGSGTITFGAISSSNWWANNGFRWGRNNEPEAPNFEQIEKAKSVYETIRNAQKQQFK